MKNLVLIRVSNSPRMSDLLNAILVLSYFPCSDFPGLLVCDEGDFGEMHTNKTVFVAGTSRLGPKSGQCYWPNCILKLPTAFQLHSNYSGPF